MQCANVPLSLALSDEGRGNWFMGSIRGASASWHLSREGTGAFLP